MDIVINEEIASTPESSTAIPCYGDFYHNLLVCLGYCQETPPVADLLRQYHHLEGEWIVVSPVHWQATHNDAMIIASGSQLALSTEESMCWFKQFKEFVAIEHMQLYYHDANIWLLQCNGKPAITSKPVHTIHHKSILPELKMLDKTLFWQRFITEAQMFFSTHSLNKSRTGLLPINGVWFWGQGNLGEKVTTSLICHDQELGKLANLLSINVCGKPRINTDKNSVHLFTVLNSHAYQILQKQLQKKMVRWYWNNGAYLSKPKNWIFRLMERV